LDILADLDNRAPFDGGTPAELGRWKRLELLRIAARDLMGIDPLEVVGAALAQLADDVLAVACRLGMPPGHSTSLAVIGMGKLGGRELNYASDIDVMFAGAGETDARAVLSVARHAWRVDVDLRGSIRNAR